MLAANSVSAVNPDNKYIWMLDIGFEKIQEAFNPKLKQVHALERIREAREMREKGRFEAADMAMNEIPDEISEDVEEELEEEQEKLSDLYTQLEGCKEIVLAKHNEFKNNAFYQQVSKEIFHDIESIGIIIKNSVYTYTIHFDNGVFSRIEDGISDDAEIIIELERGVALSLVQNIKNNNDNAIFRKLLKINLPNKIKGRILKAGIKHSITQRGKRT